MLKQRTLRGRNIGQQQLALIAILMGVCAISFSPIWVRLSDVGPISVAFWRLALAVPLLWGWTRTSSDAVPAAAPARGRYAPLMLLVPGVVFAADLATWHLAINLTSVANATFFPNMAPILVSLVAWRWLGERFRPVFVVGLSVALVGVLMMVRASTTGGETGAAFGDALALFTALFYAGYILSVKHLRQWYSAARVMLTSAAVGMSLLFVVTLLSGEVFLPADLAGWAVLLGLAWFSHAGGQGLVAYSLAQLPASLTSVMLLMQPVLAAIFAWLLLGEAMSPLQAAGGAFVLIGVLLARRGSAA